MSWTEDFQRQVIATAIRGDLLYELPLDADLFGNNRDAGPQSARQRIVGALVEYFTAYGKPSPEAFTQIVADLRVSPEERVTIDAEARACLETSVPEDSRFVRDRVRTVLEYRQLARAMEQVSMTLTDERGLESARELLSKAMTPIAINDSRNVAFMADSAARVLKWRTGDEYGERISTGFDALDVVLRGGPTRKEAFYFLAPPKGAKTASLLTVALAALRRRLGVYVVTYEMQAIRMALRVDRMLSRSTREELEEDESRLTRAYDGLLAAGAEELYIDEQPPQRPNAVATAAQRVQEIRRKGGKVDVVIFDYLNIMGASTKEREKRHELARISRDISAAGRELDVLTWSAALVNRQAVNKRVVRKTDVAEAFEIVAVADGMVAICATPRMVQAGLRRFRVVAAREEQDEVNAGDYRVDFSRMLITPADAGAVAATDSDGEEGGDGDDQG